MRKKTIIFQKMLTRKRQRDTEIQDRFNSLTSRQSYQFHPILESVTKFLKFKDCSKISKLNTMYHVKTWIYVLKSKNRYKDEPIIVDDKSCLWLRKYANSLESQHLEFLRLIKDFPNIPKVDTVSIISQYNGHIPECNHLFLSHSGEFPNLSNLETLTMTSSCREESVFFEFLDKSKDSLKELHIHWGIHGLPMLPNLEVLYYKNIGSPKLNNLSKLCPNLKQLHIKYYREKTCKSLVGLNIQKLTLESFHLHNIEDLKYLKLLELDVSKCPYITDFSPIAHIPNVHTHPNATKLLFSKKC
jgi:hypothetical protein